MFAVNGGGIGAGGLRAGLDWKGDHAFLGDQIAGGGLGD